MIAGEKAFPGESQAGVIASILEHDPPLLSTVQSRVPPALDHLVRGCLAKKPARRWQSAADAALQLSWIAEFASSGAVVTSKPQPVRKRLAVLGGIAAALVIALIAWIPLRRDDAAPPQPMRLELSTPPGNNQIAISPNGRFLVTVYNREGTFGLWLQQFGQLNGGKFMQGTEGASDPFWSPDSRFIGFYAQDKLKKIDLSGAPPQTIADAETGNSGGQGTWEQLGGTWNQDDVILFTRGLGRIHRVSAKGGTPVPLMPLDSSRREVRHSRPYFLPDGRRFLYVVSSSSPENAGVYVGSLDGNLKKRLVDARVFAAFAPPQHLLFLRGNTLMAQELNLSTLNLIGDPQILADSVMNFASYTRAAFSVSENGILVHRSAIPAAELSWFDLTDKTWTPAGDIEWLAYLQFSPDNRRLVGARNDQGNEDLWIVELERNTAVRLTSDEARESNPVWSPDGNGILYSSNREANVANLYVRESDGTGREERLLESDKNQFPWHWSADGKYILYGELNSNGRTEIWALPTFGNKTPFKIVGGPFGGGFAALSPDGRWLAYASSESGQPNQPDVYVVSFPEGKGKVRVSANGGSNPRWRADSRELFYGNVQTGQVFAVDVTSETNSAAFKAGPPRLMFEVFALRGFDVTKDGKRIILNGRIRSTNDNPENVIVTVNWFSLLPTPK